MSLVAISGNPSGTGTLTIAAPNTNSNYTLTLPEVTGTVLTNKTTGTVLQVVSTTKTDTFSSTTTGAFTDITSFSVSITPTSSSSKILVLYVAEIGLSTTVNTMLLRLMRDSTAINIGNTNGSRSRATTSQQTLYSNTNNTSRTISGNFLDSPATTSSITYKIQFRNSSGTFYLNRDGEYGDNTTNATGASTITVMEIAA